MTAFYFDTSALIKNYVSEQGGDWIHKLIDQNEGPLLVTSLLKVPEVYSAFARRLREGSVSPQNYQLNIDAFLDDRERIYQFIELSLDVVNYTRLLIETYSLRANDAVQLATAVIVNQTLTSAGIAPVTFLSADHRLIKAAEAQGLISINPNDQT